MKSEKFEEGLGRLIFFSRWIQAPVYFGLIVGVVIYSLSFFVELWHIIRHPLSFTESAIMLALLTLVDIVMIMNLVIMVILGGYYTFVDKYPIATANKLEWLDTVNAGVLKLKMSTSLIGVSSIHLLQTFINVENQSEKVIYAQIGIHFVFIISSIGLAWIEKLGHK